MRAIPNMTVLTPLDATEVRLVVRAAAAIQGPVYMRVNRNPVLDLLDKDATFELGKYRVLREGERCAAPGPRRDGGESSGRGRVAGKGRISARVASVGTMKPFNYDGALELARGMKGVVTAEEHSYIGGLAAAMAFALRRSSVPMEYVAMNDHFGESAFKTEDLQTAYGLTAENIAGKARNLVKEV